MKPGPNEKFVDFSTLASFRNCKEQSRLGYVLHLQPTEERPALSFGTAFHAGIAGFYRAIAKKISRDNAVEIAQASFVKELKTLNSALPIAMESDERRSVERGVALLEAYFEKWKSEPFKIMVRPDTGEPYVEIGFRLYVCNIDGIDIIFTGKVDRMMQSLVDGRPYNFETKSTATSLTQFIKQVRPNHQVTGYHAAMKNIGIDVAGTIWDCIFVSDRKPDLKSSDKWRTYGIDMDKDFARQDTRRSATDIEEFWFDLESTVNEFMRLQKSGLRRWERNAPFMCHAYGGCAYRDVCATNLNPAVITSKFEVKPWEPWREDEENNGK